MHVEAVFGLAALLPRSGDHGLRNSGFFFAADGRPLRFAGVR